MLEKLKRFYKENWIYVCSACAMLSGEDFCPYVR